MYCFDAAWLVREVLPTLKPHPPKGEFYLTDAIEAAQQTFETADLVDGGDQIFDLDLSKLARPTSTWTYMVHDNPLQDDTLSALSLPGVFR